MNGLEKGLTGKTIWRILLLCVLILTVTGCASKNESLSAGTSSLPAAAELTLPADAGNEELFCLVTSDLHFTLSDIASVYTLGKYTPELARAFAEEAAAKAPDVVLMCGDNTNSSRTEDMEALTAILEPLHEAGCEVILVTGNHDGSFERDEYMSYVNRLCSISERDPVSLSYAVRVGGYRFLAMDDNTAASDDEGGTYKEETVDWLRTQLKEAEKMGERAVFISHHSLMTAGNEELDDYYRINEPELAELLQVHGVRLAFTGHRHSQEILKSGELYEIISAPLMSSPHAYGELTFYERAAAYRTVPLDTESYGTRTLKEALAKEANESAENLTSIVDAVCGKRYSRAKKEGIADLFSLFMNAYSEGTIADRKEEIMGSRYYEDFLEAFEESNYGPWIRYMLETTKLPGNRAVIGLV